MANDPLYQALKSSWCFTILFYREQHHSVFSLFSPTASLADQSVAPRKSQTQGQSRSWSNARDRSGWR
jgi:hypothetical protein